MNFSALIFDLDGTLLDTLRDIALAMNSVLDARGFATHGEDDYRYFVGDGMAELCRRALPPEENDQRKLEEVLSAMKQEYARRWMDNSKPYPGIVEMLRELAGRGCKLGVLSNKPDEFTRRMVESLLPGIGFTAVIGASRPELRKPDPTNALKIAQMMGLSPDAVAFVGDSAVDVQTALNAGMFPVGVTWGLRPKCELESAGAKLLVDAPAELLQLSGRF